jgi:phospholipid transport system substrate-binding protein
MKKVLILGIAALALLGCAGNKPADGQTFSIYIEKFSDIANPVALLKQNEIELQKELNKISHAPEDIERIKHLSSGLFDFAKMTERSLPQKTLDTVSAELKAELTKEFQRMIENYSVHGFITAFNPSDSIVYDEAEYKKNNEEAWVQTHSWRKGEYTLMVYKMDRVCNSWRIWDLVIDSLSTTRNYKDQFSSILEEKSFKELIEMVKDKPDKYGNSLEFTLSFYPMDFKIKLDNIKDSVPFAAFSSQPLLIYYYGNHCPHCHTVYPEIRQLANEYEQNGLVFITISVGSKNKEDALQFMELHKEHDTSTPFFFDTEREFGKKFGDEYVPRLYLVFPNGKGIMYIDAYSEGLKGVRADLDKLFGIMKSQE